MPRKGVGGSSGHTLTLSLPHLGIYIFEIAYKTVLKKTSGLNVNSLTVCLTLIVHRVTLSGPILNEIAYACILRIASSQAFLEPLSTEVHLLRKSILKLTERYNSTQTRLTRLQESRSLVRPYI